MSHPGDSGEHNRSVEDQNEEIIKLLKALLIGIEIISNQEDLLDNVEE